MAYQAIYRKWRPAVFEDIVGQNHITQTLRNQIMSGHISHAYLFCGTRGTGKTTAAKIFSRAVNCLNPKNGSPCNECEICRGIAGGSIMDVSEIDAASNNGVENIRELREDVNYVAARTKYRVYIIDEVHMLSDGAFNALLKTLEEPPEHVIFILATTEAHKIPETILSRCQRFDFKRIRPSDIEARMREIAYGDGLKLTDEAFALLARLADGSMRDGLSILERCVSACGDSIDASDITEVLGIAGADTDFAAVGAVIGGDAAKILDIINRLVSDGCDLNLFVDGLIRHLRNLMVIKLADKSEGLIDCSAEDYNRLVNQAAKTSFEKLSNAVNVLNTARAEAKWVKSPRMIYELAFIKLAKPELDDSKEALLDRIAELEEKIKDGIKVTVAEPAAEKKAEPAPEKKKDKPSAKLFAPIDVNSLTKDSPVVVAARKWESVSAAVARKYPHIASAVVNRKITIDGEGIILLFSGEERMMKGIAARYIGLIKDMFQKETGTDFEVKTAFSEDIEDNIIDYWKISGGREAAPQPAAEVREVVREKQPKKNDPIDRLVEGFPELVEVTDDSDFVGYKPDGDNFEQSELEDDEDDDEPENVVSDAERFEQSENFN